MSTPTSSRSRAPPPKRPWRLSAQSVPITTKTPILYLVVITVLINGGLALGSAVELVFQVRVLGLHPGDIGLILGFTGAGGVFGSFISPVILKRKSQTFCLRMSVICMVPSVALIPISLGLGEFATVALSFEGFVYSTLIVIFNVNLYTLLVSVTPKSSMARQISVLSTATMGITPIASLAGGFIGDHWGYTETLWMWVATSIIAAISVVAFDSPLQRLKEEP